MTSSPLVTPIVQRSHPFRAARAIGLATLGLMLLPGTALATSDNPPPPPAVAPDAPKPARAAARYASPAETRLRAQLDAQLRPLIARKLSDADGAVIKGVLALRGDAFREGATTAVTALRDKDAVTLMKWLRLLEGKAPAVDYRAFLTQHPGWPREMRMRRYFERALLEAGAAPGEVKRDFERFQPVSGSGLMALAIAERALGNASAARRIAKETWCEKRFDSDNEDEILAALGSYLEPADHKCRLDRLLISNPRLKFIRQSRAAAATRLVELLADDQRDKARARIKAFSGGNALPDLIAVVRQADLVKGDWGLAYQRAQRSRRNGDYAHAYKILAAVPGEDANHINRDEWWEERERHARHWLDEGKAKRAYDLVADVRPREANPAKAQAFFAGWLALMHLEKAAPARDHFKRMVARADGPLSKSQAEYWLARAYRALGDETSARRHFGESAKIRDTFHGLLARREVTGGNRAIDLPAPALADAATAARFVGNEVVRGLVIATQLGFSRRTVLAFYRTLGAKLETEGELALLGQLANLLGDGQGEVRAGKTGIARGFNTYEFAYPVQHLPDYKALRKPIEPAMLLAIARQESEFNTEIVSRAGARGVLQVMPVTARHVCRQYAIRCNLKALLRDPTYNTQIASAYIADRRDEFGGSYILTLTGFNAGPGRTRQWLREMGDPRRRGVDPFDWIYRIPFEETRLYVRKVLSNAQIYRARLGLKDPLQIDRDLRRGSRS